VTAFFQTLDSFFYLFYSLADSLDGVGRKEGISAQLTRKAVQ
jgi:hypothetical protein